MFSSLTYVGYDFEHWLFSLVKVYIPIKKHLIENNHNYKNVTIDLFPDSCFLTSSFKWRVTVSEELIFLESYGNCDVTNTVTLLL